MMIPKLRETLKTLDTMIDFAPLPRARMVVGDLSCGLHAPFGIHGIALCSYLFRSSITLASLLARHTEGFGDDGVGDDTRNQ